LEDRNRNYLLEILKRVQPRPAEAVEVPLWTARAWLRDEAESLSRLSDASEAAPDPSDARRRGRRAFRYLGGDDDRSRAIWPDDIRPGDLIIVPATAEYGGCDEWGWHPTFKAPVADLAEAAAWPYRGRRYAVRVTAELIHQHAMRAAGSDATEPGADLEEIRDRLHSAITGAAEEADAPAILEAIWVLDLAERLRSWLQPLRDRAYRRRLSEPFFYREEAGRRRGVIFVAPFGLKEEVEIDDIAAPPATESDDIGLFGGYPLLLEQHSKDVREAAAQFANHAGLPRKLAADVALAGYLHDLGKSDPRFQAYLAGGDLLGWDENHLLAKSGRDRLPKDAWNRAQLPENWRHEALSVCLARSYPEFSEAYDPMLVLWLVGVHHGYGRPLFPHADPEEPIEQPGPQSLGFDFNGWDWAQIFEELKRAYGIWGLARLEAFVRLADHRASEAAARRYADEAAR
jgi:CRISPR-associated endonuclease/helicase Cas3